jgi:hypothetical protein
VSCTSAVRFGLSASDASAFDLSVTRSFSSCRPANGAQQEGQAAIFGPQWTAGTTAEISDSDWTYLRKTSATSVAVVDVDGEETGFTATSNGGWKPESGAEDLTLTGSLTGSFTLKDTDGTTAVFNKVDSTATTWQLATTLLPAHGPVHHHRDLAENHGGRQDTGPAHVRDRAVLGGLRSHLRGHAVDQGLPGA